MFHLDATIDHHLTHYGKSNPSISQVILWKVQSSVYDDNLLSGANRLDDAKAICRYYKEVFVDAAMNLRKWNLNSKEIEKFLSANKENSRDFTERSYAQEILRIIHNCNLKDLGISRNKEDD